MVRDVLIAAMNKGQLIPAFVGLIFMLMIVKMPGTDVSSLMFKIFDLFGERSILGYILFIISLGSWATHVRFQRRLFHGELLRVSDERNKLQKNHLGGKLESSNKS